MPKYLVRFLGYVDVGVYVEVDDPEDAWDAAYDKLPGSICAQCTGWGNDGKWFREVSGEYEPYIVEDENGNEVSSELTHIDQLQKEVQQLRAEVKRLKNVF